METITKTKRIQDGVVRIEFVSGDSAKEFVKKKQQDSESKEKEEKVKEQEKEKRIEQRQIAKERIPVIAKSLLECKQGTITVDEITMELADSGKANFCYSLTKISRSIPPPIAVSIPDNTITRKFIPNML